MNIQNLFTNETTIKVSVVTLDNKRLTKSIYNQLHYKKPFDKLYNINDGVQFLGYVHDKGQFVVFKEKSKLYVCNLDAFRVLRDIDLDKNTIEYLYKVYPSDEVEQLYRFNSKNDMEKDNYRDMQISQVFSIKGQYEFIDKAEKLQNLINEIFKRQIFL